TSLTTIRAPVNIHKNARLSAWARQSIVTRVAAGESQGAIGEALGVSRETVNKWYRRLTQSACPVVAAVDRSSRPHRSPMRTARRKRRQILQARQRRWSSPRIAQHYAVPLSTVTAELRRLG